MLLLKEKHVLGLHETVQGSDFPSPLPLLPPPPPPLSMNNYENKISPSILLIIVILAVIFFISGVLHLLVRFLLRPTTARDPESSDNATALQGQLQELFHLHDAGVDQSFIDTLPVFLYKAITGLKDPFDCAVCLCEFEPEDKLRLLPKCSHAFHIECIDTWLLSHSTCPLCRRSLFPDFSSPVNNSCSPIVLLLESRSESSREILASNREETGQNPLLDFAGEAGEAVADEKVVPVKLGKFRNVDIGGGGSGGGEGSSSGYNGNLEQSQRRCFSMGSYAYVMDQSCMLQVAVKPVKKKLSMKRPGYRAVMSECDCHSKREGFKVLDESKSSELRVDGSSAEAASAASLQRRESFSVSKIWLRPKGEKRVGGDSSRRAFSFRFPLQEELDLGERKEKGGSEEDLDVEVGSCVTSFGSQIEETPSFARRTLLWIVGRQSKVGSDH